jgi:small subunit ribosomal protein S20
MANHASALKAQRQNLKRRARNKGHRSELRTALKRFSASLDKGASDDSAGSLAEICSTIDRAVQKKVLSKNAAARRKSRLTKRMNALSKTSQ